MAHRTRKPAYSRLVERLNYFPQGAPPSKYLNKILQILFSEKEANLVALLPIKPFTAKKAAEIWNKKPKTACKILEELAERGLMVDVDRDGQTFYVLPPPMAGFFEFSMMRVRDDLDQKILSELFQKYLDQEDNFIKALFTGETQFGRALVNEDSLSRENALYVLDYEKASEIIESASHMAVSMCYCRHKMKHLGQACDAPMEICMSFGQMAQSLANHGQARLVEDRKEGLDMLGLAYEQDLVQFGENVQEDISFICNCCSCCCEALRAARDFASMNPIHTTNFLPALNHKKCQNCGHCLEICPVNALSYELENRIFDRNGVLQLEQEVCLGCGLCVKDCPTGALELKSREERVITPVNSAHRIVMMAIERGKLQDLIFDNKILFSHRALATVLGTILKLPPVKQITANKTLKSRYLAYLIKYFEGKHYNSSP